MENQDLTPRLVLVVALALAGPASGQEAIHRGAATNVGTAAAKDTELFEQVVKLWKAGLSEEFLLRKVEREPVVYRLSTDDIIACKAAGVPESIIEAMMKTGSQRVPAAEPVVPSAVPVVAVPPAAPAASVASPSPRVDRSWEGMVRRSPGVVLFRSPWEPGRLSILENEIQWFDAGDAARNLVLPLTKIQEQFLVCPRDTSTDRDCFEWGVKTEDAEFRFRDVARQREESPKLLELFSSLKALSPNLVSTKYRAKKG